MRFIKKLRYIPYQQYSGSQNMAIDEYLISFYYRTKKPVLRLYGWDPLAISLGRHQDINNINIKQCFNDNIYIVRRMTGGGAICHDKELTYSLVCSENDIQCQNYSIKESFEKLNLFILDMYKELGLRADYAKFYFNERLLGERSSFCFSKNEEYDILIKEKKIGGNAQRRWKNIIFQHGSIPLVINKNRVKKYFKGNIDFKIFTSLNELLNQNIDIEKVITYLTRSFTNRFGFELEKEEIYDSEKEYINNFFKKKYNNVVTSQ